jgi:hypothetical protein
MGLSMISNRVSAIQYHLSEVGSVHYFLTNEKKCCLGIKAIE